MSCSLRYKLRSLALQISTATSHPPRHMRGQGTGFTPSVHTPQCPGTGRRSGSDEPLQRLPGAPDRCATHPWCSSPPRILGACHCSTQACCPCTGPDRRGSHASTSNSGEHDAEALATLPTCCKPSCCHWHGSCWCAIALSVSRGHQTDGLHEEKTGAAGMQLGTGSYCQSTPVGCVEVLGDESEPHAWHRLHSGLAQDFHMTVSAAQQHDLLSRSSQVRSATRLGSS